MQMDHHRNTYPYSTKRHNSNEQSQLGGSGVSRGWARVRPEPAGFTCADRAKVVAPGMEGKQSTPPKEGTRHPVHGTS